VCVFVCVFNDERASLCCQSLLASRLRWLQLVRSDSVACGVRCLTTLILDPKTIVV
jgi:hypothetical protein